MKRLLVMVAALGVMIGCIATAEAAPVRSGMIVGGAGIRLGGGQPFENPALQRSGCEYAAECLAWMHSGCNPALAGQDTALTASIVDVAELAGRRTWKTLSMQAPKMPPWGLWPGVVIQFWGRGCNEIAGAKRHTIGPGAPCGWYGGEIRCALRIPREAAWMTLSGYATTVQLSWTLA